MKASALICSLGICFILFATGCSGDSDNGNGDETAITSVQSGPGLSGGGDSGDIVLEADTDYLQRRVTAECTGEKAIQSISSIGGVVCSENFALENHSHTEYAAVDHNHDADYSSIDHNHDADYSAIDHNHDADYSATDHNHDGVYSPAAHNHDASYLARDVAETTTAEVAAGLSIGTPSGVFRAINDSTQSNCGVTDCDKTGLVGSSVGDNAYKYGVMGYAGGTGARNVGVMGRTSGEADVNLAGYFAGDTVITGHLKLSSTGPGFTGVSGLSSNDVGGYFVVGNFHNVTIDLPCDTLCARHGMECALAFFANGTMSDCNHYAGDVNNFEYCWCQKR